MRYSKYNLYFCDQNKQEIVYNTLTNTYVTINKNDINLREKLIKNKMITQLTENEESAMCDAVFYQNNNSELLHITIITTKQCNFACKYCAQNPQGEKMQEATYSSIERYIIRNVASFRSLKITLFGGEPTLAVDHYESFLKRIYEICKYYRKQYQVAMISNGYLLDEDMITRLYQAHVWQYTITLDGLPNLHNYYRPLKNGDPSFQKIYENLMKIAQRTDIPHLYVVIRINVTKCTAQKIEEWKELYEKLLDNPRFFLELNVVENRGGSGIKEMSNMLVSANSPEYITVANVFSKYRNGLEKLKPNIFVCSYVNAKSLTVDCQGELRACSKLYINNYIGRLSKNGVAVIEKEMPLFTVKHDPKCYGCAVEPLCHGKRCGFSTICIYNEILFVIQENLRKEGICVCQMLAVDNVVLPFGEVD